MYWNVYPVSLVEAVGVPCSSVIVWTCRIDTLGYHHHQPHPPKVVGPAPPILPYTVYHLLLSEAVEAERTVVVSVAVMVVVWRLGRICGIGLPYHPNALLQA